MLILEMGDAGLADKDTKNIQFKVSVEAFSLMSDVIPLGIIHRNLHLIFEVS